MGGAIAMSFGNKIFASGRVAVAVRLDIDLVPSHRTRHIYCGSTCINNGPSVAEICHFSPYLVNMTLTLTATTLA